MKVTRNGTQPSRQGSPEWFTGKVWVDPLFMPEEPARASGAKVTFEPGARTAWHAHSLGQTLIVTDGCGRVQRWGGPVEEVHPGDVVWFEPGEKHWHGASPTTPMSHIAVVERTGDTDVMWGEHVSDEQYNGTDKIMENLTFFINGESKALSSVNSFATIEKIEGKEVIRARKDLKIEAFDEPTFIRLPESEFRNGVIEVSVMSKLLADAPEYARGFIGVAFRIDEHNSRFECIYLRPTNGRTEDPMRRNHATQYFSYPNFKFDRLRKEFPEKYESCADIGLNEWIKVRIEVSDDKAKLYLNDDEQPVLFVEDLKHGSDTSGGIGLWVEIGTDGYFRDLHIENK